MEASSAMSDSGACGCCAGTSVEVPVGKENRPGLPALAYRVGTHPKFLASLLARLSTRDFPGLARLTTRPQPQRADRSFVPEDWTLGMLDAFATLADVITFYSERIANEAFLRTAVERRSVRDLARLVGYEIAPGVAASTSLAFTLAVPRVSPAPMPQPILIPIGTRVQSVPGPEEIPQTFETIEAITARPEWNDLRPELFRRQRVKDGQRSAWLVGISTQLQPGDRLLFVGEERESDPDSENWQAVEIRSIELDALRNLTYVAWVGALDSFHVEQDAKCFALRQRAALFGHNAIDPNLLSLSHLTDPQRAELVTKLENSTLLQWVGFATFRLGTTIDLDAVYPKVTEGSWVVFETETSLELSRVKSPQQQVTDAKFGISAKVSRLILDKAASLDRRGTVVRLQSEPLELAARPLLFPVYGDRLVLGKPDRSLQSGQPLAISGKRARLRVVQSGDDVTFLDDAERQGILGESFIVLAPPRSDDLVLEPEVLDDVTGLTANLIWQLMDHDGRPIRVEASAGAVEVVPAGADDELVRELAEIEDNPVAVEHTAESTRLELSAALTQCYDRHSLHINANVAAATNGERVSEVLGSGDAAYPNQRFALRQSPLTYVPAPTDQGRESTLELQVNDLRWKQVPSLYGRGPTDRVYALRQTEEGPTIVQFGDGVEGARLPTGLNNLRATYRKGIGLIGNVRGGTLTTLLARPLGVEAAINPEPAVGGEDPESLDAARRNAPNTVLTLDRVVSATDYADYARAFAGISKASAIWLESKAFRGIYVSVAAVGGAALAPDGETLDALIQSFRTHGDALVPLRVDSFTKVPFVLRANIRVASGYDPDSVLAQVTSVVRDAFGFEARDFGQPVSIDEVMAVVHRVEGVEGADVDALHRSDVAEPAQLEPRIFPNPSRVNDDGTRAAAELLVLDEDRLDLTWKP
jgi:hypothetical protein